MGIRLYDSAWVLLNGLAEPQRVDKDRANPAVFIIGGFRYDIDGRAYRSTELVPTILEILSLSAARQQGLSTAYKTPSDKHLLPVSHF